METNVQLQIVKFFSFSLVLWVQKKNI